MNLSLRRNGVALFPEQRPTCFDHGGVIPCSAPALDLGQRPVDTESGPVRTVRRHGFEHVGHGIDVQLTKLENAIDRLNQELRGKDADEVVKKRKYHDELVRRETVSLGNIDVLTSELAKIRKQIDDLARSINANPSARNTRSTLLANIYKGIETSFRLSIDALRERLKSEVERKATDAFLELTTQKDYSGLKINSNYGLTILDELGEAVPLRSAGAEQIVALSLIDGLSRTGRAAGPVVMDTPFGRLDPKHRANILNYLPKHASQLILLVHEGEINRTTDLSEIAHRIGAEYEIKEKSLRYSKIEKI